MEKILITASKRDVKGKKVDKLRREGYLPAVLYGAHIQPTPIVMDYRESSRTLSSISSSSLVTISLDGVEHTALVREKQRDTLKGIYLHIDFMAVSLTEAIRTPVSIELVGDSPAVKDYNGVLITGVTEVDVECLPQDLPEKFTVDISALKNIGDSITVSQLTVSDKVTLHTPGDELVVHIAHAAGEEAEGAVSAAEPEVIEKGKKEEEF